MEKPIKTSPSAELKDTSHLISSLEVQPKNSTRSCLPCYVKLGTQRNCLPFAEECHGLSLAINILVNLNVISLANMLALAVP